MHYILTERLKNWRSFREMHMCVLFVHKCVRICFQIYISRIFMIFHCIISVYFVSFFEAFECTQHIVYRFFFCIYGTHTEYTLHTNIESLHWRRTAPFKHSSHMKKTCYTQLSYFSLFIIVPFCVYGHKLHI